MSRWLAVAFACALGARAGAEPRSDPTAGRAVFTGAATPSVTSLDVDPAALGLGNIDELYIAGTDLVDSYAIHRRTIDLSTGALSSGPTVRTTDASLAAMGGAFGGVLHLKDRGTLGGMIGTLPVENFIADQPALQYATLGGSERVLYAVFGGSLKVADPWHIGISFRAEERYLHLKFARDTALEAGNGPGGVTSDCGNGAPCGVENPAATEIYDIHVRSRFFSQDTFSVNIGMLFILAPNMYLGFGVHSVPGVDAVTNALGVSGTINVTRAPRDGGGVVHGVATVDINEPAAADVEFRMQLPAELDLHAGFRVEQLSRLQEYDIRAYGSTLPPNGIPGQIPRARGFDDAYAAWVGVEQIGREKFDIGDRWRFGGRIGFESASVPTDRTSPMQVDPFSLTLDGGAQLRLHPRVAVQATYGLQYYLPVHVTQSAYDPRARIDCIASGYDYSTPGCAAVRGGYALPTAAGDYQRIEQAFRLALRIMFP